MGKDVVVEEDVVGVAVAVIVNINSCCQCFGFGGVVLVERYGSERIGSIPNFRQTDRTLGNRLEFLAIGLCQNGLEI